jgi:hypothetical protein
VRINKGNEGRGYVKAINERTIQVGGPKIGIILRKKIITNAYIKMLKTIPYKGNLS